MNKKIFFLVGVIALVCGFMFCGDDSPSDDEDKGVSDELIGHWNQVSPDSIDNYFVGQKDTIVIASTTVLSPVSAQNGQIWSVSLGKYYYDYSKIADTIYLLPETTSVATNPTPTTAGVMKLIQQLTVVGNWAELIPAQPPIIPKALTVGINIEKKDSSFLIYVTEDPAKKLFNHEGFWAINGDSIYLDGTFCEMIDTSADPDTLKPLPDSVCQQTIVIDTARTPEDIWIIKVGQLGPIIESFPIDPGLIDIIKNIDLYMERQ